LGSPVGRKKMTGILIGKGFDIGAGGGTRSFFPAFAAQISLISLRIQHKST
jgi:hypothetical protein